MAIICDICGDRVGQGKRKVMLLNENTDGWFYLCKTCERLILSYAIKDLPKLVKPNTNVVELIDGKYRLKKED